MKQDSIRTAYEQYGTADAFYRAEGSHYRNPHEEVLADLIPRACASLDKRCVLDLAAGSGEATLALRAAGVEVGAACDPFTSVAYERRTGRSCERWSFEDVAGGVLPENGYSLVICSFALHLCPPSRLPAVSIALSRSAPTLLLLTPHKKPQIRSDWGWVPAEEILDRRVRARIYQRSTTS